MVKLQEAPQALATPTGPYTANLAREIAMPSKGTRRRGSVPRICERCGASFLVDPYSIHQGNGRFCSLSCARRTAPLVAFTCQQCGRRFEIQRYRAERGDGKFCSKSCSDASKSITPSQQLELHVDRSGGPDACWPWNGDRNWQGYGRFGHRGRVLKAHQVAWEVANGRSVPDGLIVRHLCQGGGNPWCCNPRHLDTGTHRQNSDDKLASERQARGSGHGHARLTESQVRQIRAQASAGEPQRQIARQFGVSQPTVAMIVRRKTWRHLA